MDESWKTFTVKTLENNAPNAPTSYAVTLSEKIKDGVQNNTRLSLNPNLGKGEVNIEGTITSYSVMPIALQEGDNAAKNRLTVTVNFTIFVTKPEEEEMTLTSTRFVDYDSKTDLASVESTLLEEVTTQVVQDVINKLLSNW
jgi:3-phenylpropionate/cinnamic acid dioxygenase small subunit